MQSYPHGELVVVLDCANLDRSAAFWCQVLGYRRYGTGSFGPYVSLHPDPDRGGPELLLQRVADVKRGKNRMHLDLRTADLDAEVRRVLSAGATLRTTDPVVEDEWRWHILADPDGNEFCVLQPP